MTYLLVIEDNAVIRLYLATALEGAGYHVRTAANGLACGDMLRQGCVDLVITDILMPERDGLEVIRDLHARRPQVKIIAVSGGGHLDATYYLGMAIQFGADAVLEKPFGMAELLGTVSACVGRPECTL